MGDYLKIYKIGDYVLFLATYLYECTSIKNGDIYFEFVNQYDIDETHLPMHYIIVNNSNYNQFKNELFILPNSLDISLFNHPNYINLIEDKKKIVESRGLDIHVGDLVCCYNKIYNKIFYGIMYSNTVCITKYGFFQMEYNYTKINWDFKEKDKIKENLIKLYKKHERLSFNKELLPGTLFLYNKKLCFYLGVGDYIKHLQGYEVANFKHVYLYLEYNDVNDIESVINYYDKAQSSNDFMKKINDSLYLTKFNHKPYPNLLLESINLIPDFLYEKYELDWLDNQFYLLEEFVNSGYIFKYKDEVNINDYLNYVSVKLYGGNEKNDNNSMVK